MEVHAKIDEADIGRIRVGQHAIFRVDAFPGRKFAGQVTQIRKAPEVVKNVVIYHVVIATDNAELLLLPGMTALIEIVVQETDEVLKLPNAALRYTPGEVYRSDETPKSAISDDVSVVPTRVWVLGPNGDQKPVHVKLGLSNATMTEIIDGPFSEGQEVIVGVPPEASEGHLFGLRWGF
jgi:HlyD family secretion protein